MIKPEELIADKKVIDKLENEELDILRKLNEKCDQIKTLKAQYWLKTKGLEMNDAIQFTTGKGLGEKTLSGKIIGFEYSGTNPWAPRILLFNADGNIGKVVRRLTAAETETIKKI